MAWLGGAAFVASLATFGWCYTVRFGNTAPAGEGTGGALAWNLGLFSAFALHHSVMARTAIDSHRPESNCSRWRASAPSRPASS